MVIDKKDLSCGLKQRRAFSLIEIAINSVSRGLKDSRKGHATKHDVSPCGGRSNSCAPASLVKTQAAAINTTTFIASLHTHDSCRLQINIRQDVQLRHCSSPPALLLHACRGSSRFCYEREAMAGGYRWRYRRIHRFGAGYHCLE
jgi:hypothetical protein